MIVIDAIIEIPEGSANKYEWDRQAGRLRLDRVLWGSMHYPINYGFIPQTWADDADPLDVLVFASQPIYPATHVAVRLIGGLSMADEHGPDDKLIAVVHPDPRWDDVQQISDLAPHRLKEIRHFFQEYKTLQGLSTAVGDYLPIAEAEALLRRCQAQFPPRTS